MIVLDHCFARKCSLCTRVLAICLLSWLPVCLYTLPVCPDLWLISGLWLSASSWIHTSAKTHLNVDVCREYRFAGVQFSSMSVFHKQRFVYVFTGGEKWSPFPDFFYAFCTLWFMKEVDHTKVSERHPRTFAWRANGASKWKLRKHQKASNECQPQLDFVRCQAVLFHRCLPANPACIIC